MVVREPPYFLCRLKIRVHTYIHTYLNMHMYLFMYVYLTLTLISHTQFLIFHIEKVGRLTMQKCVLYTVIYLCKGLVFRQMWSLHVRRLGSIHFAMFSLRHRSPRRKTLSKQSSRSLCQRDSCMNLYDHLIFILQCQGCS